MSNEYEEAKSASDAVVALAKAKKDLADLKREEAEYLKEREVKAKERLKDVVKTTQEAEILLRDMKEMKKALRASMTDNREVVDKANDACKALQTARREFEELKKEEQAYLVKREKEVSSALGSVTVKTRSATNILEALNKKIEKLSEKVSDAVRSFLQRIESLTERGETYLTTAQHTLQIAQKTKRTYETLLDDLNEKTRRNSEWEKDLKQKIKDAEKREEEAQDMLQEALHIADWAKKGKSYTITNKHRAYVKHRKRTSRS